MPYDYELQREFQGDPEHVLALLRTRLTERKISWQQLGNGQLQFQGTPVYLEKRADPLLGVSQGTVFLAGGMLTLNAVFDCLRASVKFLAILLAALSIPDIVILGVVFTTIEPNIPLLILTQTLAFVIPAGLIWGIYSFRKSALRKSLAELVGEITGNS